MGRGTHRAPGKDLTPGRVQVRGRSGKSHGVVGGGFCPFSAGTLGFAPTSSASPSGCKGLHWPSETRGCLQGRDAKQVYKDHARWPQSTEEPQLHLQKKALSQSAHENPRGCQIKSNAESLGWGPGIAFYKAAQPFLMEKVGSRSHQETLFKTIQKPKSKNILQNNWHMLLKNLKVIKDKDWRIFKIKETWQLNAMGGSESDSGWELFFFFWS